MKKKQKAKRRQSAAPPARTQAAELVALAGNADLFHSPDHRAYATVRVKEHRETHLIRSSHFQEWLMKEFYTKFGKPPDPSALQQATGLLLSKARFEGQERPVFLRVAGMGDRVYIDLGDDTWQAVVISGNGYRIVAPPVRFRRSPGMAALPRPEEGGSIDELRNFVNVATEDDFVLLVSFLVGAANPKGPYPILELLGEQGTAKSTTARVIRELIDPNTSPIRALPANERDLVIAANNGWCPVFDNVSELAEWMSDALSRLSTGGGFSTRTLYTDADEQIFEVQRPAVVTALGDVILKGDLLDRAIVLRLPVLPLETRETEQQFWKRFNEAKPRIFGALLRAVSGALSAKDLSVQNLPRLADFALWVAKAETALGWATGTFARAYSRNRDESHNIIVDHNTVAQLILELAEGGGWRGTPTELLGELTTRAATRNPPLTGLPRSASRLGVVLSELAPHLRPLGIEILRPREGHRGTRMVHIRKQEVAVSAVSAVSEDKEAA